MCKNIKSVVGQRFVKGTGHMIYGSNQPTQQKPGIERLWFRKGLWRILMSNGSDACDFHLKTNKFLRILYQQKHCHPVLRGTERRIPWRDRDSQGNATWRQRQILEQCIYKPRNVKDCANHQKSGRGKEGPSPRAWLTPWFQASRLHSAKEHISVVFSHLVGSSWLQQL